MEKCGKEKCGSAARYIDTDYTASMTSEEQTRRSNCSLSSTAIQGYKSESTCCNRVENVAREVATVANWMPRTTADVVCLMADARRLLQSLADASDDAQLLDVDNNDVDVDDDDNDQVFHPAFSAAPWLESTSAYPLPVGNIDLLYD